LLEMTQKGISREVAYRLVQQHAMDTWDKGGSFKERILGDSEFMDLMSKEEIERIFSLEENLRNIDAIFQRTLGK
jgi:adenylosuccinate lyase